MKTRPGYSRELRERAVRLVLSTEYELSPRWASAEMVQRYVRLYPQHSVQYAENVEHRYTQVVQNW